MSGWKYKLARAAIVIAFVLVCYVIVQAIVFPVRYFGAEHGWQVAWAIAIPTMIALALIDKWLDRDRP